MRVEHQARIRAFGPVHGGLPVQVQVVVSDAAIPIGTGLGAWDVVHRLQHKGNGTAGLHRGHEVVLGQPVLAGTKVLRAKRQRPLAGKHHPLQPGITDCP